MFVCKIKMAGSKKKSKGGAIIRKRIAAANALAKRKLRTANNGEMYALVTKNLGDRRFRVRCNDNKVRTAHVRGSMKRIRIAVDDIILVSLREFEKNDNKCDILYKYMHHEAIRLSQQGYLCKEISMIEQRKDIDGSSSSDDEDDEPEIEPQPESRGKQVIDLQFDISSSSNEADDEEENS